MPGTCFTQRPSGYFLADVFIMLHFMLNEKLYAGRDVLDAAGADAKWLKAVIGYLRYLFRHTDLSRDPIIEQLKKLLKKNPGTKQLPNSQIVPNSKVTTHIDPQL